MAANPRGGEGADKGSRYFSERLVGPGVIEQNTYSDISKSHKATEPVVPVPMRDGLGVFPGGPGNPIGTTAGVRGLGGAVAGDTVRIVPSGLSNTTATGAAGDATSTTPVISGFVFKSAENTSLTTDLVGFLINFHSLEAPFYVIIPPEATHVLFQANFGNSTDGVIDGAAISVEISPDN